MSSTFIYTTSCIYTLKGTPLLKIVIYLNCSAKFTFSFHQMPHDVWSNSKILEEGKSEAKSMRKEPRGETN